MNGISPLVSVSSHRSPLAGIDVAAGEGLLQGVFESLPRGSSVAMTRGLLAKQGNLRQAVIFHPGDMSCPAQLGPQQSGLDAGDVSLLENFNIRDIVSPVDLENGAEAALVEPFQEANVAAVGDPGFRAVQKGGQYNCFVYAHFCVYLEVVIVPDSSVQPAECTVGPCQPVVNLLVDFGIGGYDAPQVAELLDIVEQGAVDGNAWWL